MGLPSVLKNYATYVDGTDYTGDTETVVLPKLSRKLEGHRDGGMNGEIELDFGQEKMEAEIKGAGWSTGIFKSWGARAHDAAMVRFAGALRSDDGAATKACEVVMRGRLSEIDMGNAEAGKKGELSYKYSLSYYKLTIDGEVIIEIDLVNMIEIVGGNDNLSDVRTALGR